MIRTTPKSRLFGRLLRSLRGDRRLSQAELARLSGGTQSAISRYEIGTCVPLDDRIECVMAALRASRSDTKLLLDIAASARMESLTVSPLPDIVDVGGIEISVSETAAQCRVTEETIRDRIDRYRSGAISAEKVFHRGKMTARLTLGVNPETRLVECRTVASWAKILGISHQAVSQRTKKNGGWATERKAT